MQICRRLYVVAQIGPYRRHYFFAPLTGREPYVLYRRELVVLSVGALTTAGITVVPVQLALDVN